jgi:hypothetical protein
VAVRGNPVEEKLHVDRVECLWCHRQHVQLENPESQDMLQFQDQVRENKAPSDEHREGLREVWYLTQDSTVSSTQQKFRKRSPPRFANRWLKDAAVGSVMLDVLVKGLLQRGLSPAIR